MLEGEGVFGGGVADGDLAFAVGGEVGEGVVGVFGVGVDVAGDGVGGFGVCGEASADLVEEV